MPVSEQVAERLTDLANTYWLAQLKEREEAAEQTGREIHKLTPEQKQRDFTAYLRIVKRIPHQGYSTFDDASPDPGCHWEVDKRQFTYYPAKYKDASLNKPQTVISGDQNNPDIKRLVEQLREAHWKLTAPKGFASLKGIPELQQLLAYTAADVAHYAAESDELGQHGSWRPNFAKEKLLGDSYDHLSSLDDKSSLHRGLSDDGLIGQLAPGLRLCLAAEVATGLLCDSQPLPPDTPEHASALLLFLAAALKQAEQECQPMQYWPAGGSWRLNPSLPNLKDLVDFVACADIQAVLQTGLSRACMQAAAGSSSGSNGSNGSSRIQVQQPADSCSNVLLAAYCLAVSVLSASQQQQRQQQQEEHHHHHHQQQQQQEQQSVQGLVSEAASMLEAFFQDLQQQQQQQQQAHPEATAAAANGHHSQPGDDSSSSSSSGGSSGGSSAPTAAEVAWHTAVVAGGAALALLLSGLPAGHRPWEQQQEQQQQQQPQHEPGVADMWTATSAVQLALLSAAVQALHETVVAVLQDTEASIQQQQLRQQHSGPRNGQQQDMQQQQHQQVQAHGLQLCAARQQDSTGAAMGVAKQRVLSELLAVVETGRVFQEALCQQQAAAAATTAQGQSGHSSSSSSGGGGCSTTAVLGQAGFTDLTAVYEVFEAVKAKRSQHADYRTADPLPQDCQEVKAGALLRLQLLPRVPFSPQLFFQQIFTLLGQQQLSPVCLHPDAQQQQRQQGSVAAQQQQQQQQQHVSSDTLAAIRQALQQSGEVLQAAAAAACQAEEVTAARLPEALQELPECGQQWMATVTTAYCGWLEQQQQQQHHAVPGGVPSCSNGTSAAAPAAGFAHGDTAAAGGADCLQPLVSDPDTCKSFQQLLKFLTWWQEQWTKAAAELAGSDMHRRQECITELRMLLMMKSFKHQHHQQKEQREKQQQPRKQTGKGSSKKQKQHKGSAAAAAAAAAAGSSGKAGQTAAAAGRERSADDGWAISSDEENADPAQDDSEIAQKAAECRMQCDLCAREREAGLLNSSSSSRECSGLYDSFPAHWSDPYLMRRLLWDLLGRVKPTAQAWFRQYAFMCPHRGTPDEWGDVALSIARHIWGPTGEWDDSCEQQLALPLPLRVREPLQQPKEERTAADAAARQQYAHCLSAAFAQQGPDGQVAAVLSLQVLLSLDPHGARVQPRPELLFYTPAGFHAAVAKTLMQALQPAPQHQQLLQAAAGQAKTGSGGLSNGRAAAAAAAAGNAIHHQQPQHQEQQQTEEEQQHTTEPHYLQAWTSAALPVWYVWWHIGLLAYHQQQQQQPGAESSSSSCCSQTLQEVYNSPEARLSAVGYAARQVSSRAQLERLLSNSPSAAAGLGLHPADWVLLGPSKVVCAHCSREVEQGSFAVCCRLCWGWFCRLDCLLRRCQTGGCCMDPLIQAKSIHRWRVLDLLKASMTPQQQQTAPAAAATPQAAAAAATGADAACIPAATQHALPGLFASLLQEQQRQQAAGQRQLVDGRLQWQKQQQPGLGYPRVLRLFETPVWGLAGIHEPWDGQGKQLRELTESFASGYLCMDEPGLSGRGGFWEKARRWRQMSLTPRQKRLEDQRRQREREQRQQQQHQHVPDWGEYERLWSQQRQGRLGRFGQPRGYGPHPEALARAAAEGGDGAAGGGFNWDLDWDPTEPLPWDSDGGSNSSTSVSHVMAAARRAWLGKGAEGDEIDAVFPERTAAYDSGVCLDGSSSGSDAGSAAAAMPAVWRHAWEAPGPAGAAADAAAGSVGGVGEEENGEEGGADVVRSMLASLFPPGDARESLQGLAESLLSAAAGAGADASAGVDRRDVLRLLEERERQLLEEYEWLTAEAGGSVLDRLDDFDAFDPLAGGDPSATVRGAAAAGGLEEDGSSSGGCSVD